MLPIFLIFVSWFFLLISLAFLTTLFELKNKAITNLLLLLANVKLNH